MRADRLLSIMLLLQRHGRLTAKDLAARLEVSDRTIYRDMDALSMAGVPVHTERGQGGGCVLQETYRTKLTGLSESEVRTLVISSPPHLLKDLGLGGVSQTALIKLLASLPAVARRNAEIARERIYVDAASWRQAIEPVPFLPVLQEAVWAERKLHLRYERVDMTITERYVDSLGLVSKGGLWYLIAGAEGNYHSYRVSRIHTATITDEHFARPDEFDLATYWQQSLTAFKEQLPHYPATLRIAAEMQPFMRVTGTYAQIGEPGPPDSEGWVTLPIVFGTEDDACAYVFRFGSRIRIVHPRSLQERVHRTATEVAALYTDDQSSPPTIASCKR